MSRDGGHHQGPVADPEATPETITVTEVEEVEVPKKVLTEEQIRAGLSDLG